MWDVMALRKTQEVKVKHIYMKYNMNNNYEYYGEY